MRPPRFSGERTMELGTQAPDFSLSTAEGETVRLSDYRGKKTVVLFFYPKDETPGCTAEACSFRDSYDSFVQAGAEVLGISSDGATSHQKFAQRYRLPFKLLTDADGDVKKKFGVKGSLLGLIPGRVTFVIDRNGVVRHQFTSQLQVERHVEEALRVVKDLNGAAA
jgi:peroxiredoxin Q/BCP